MNELIKIPEWKDKELVIFTEDPEDIFRTYIEQHIQEYNKISGNNYSIIKNKYYH